MNRSRLRKLIKAHFSSENLKTLCFDLGIEFDDLPGTTLDAKARELINFCKRTGRLADLLDKLKEERPNVDWSGPLSSLSISRTLDTQSESLDRTLEAEITPLYDEMNKESQDKNDQSELKHEHSTKEGFIHNLGERSLGIIGIPSDLNRQLRAVLLRCGPFETQGELNAIFVDTRLAPWQNQLPQTNSSKVARVESVINFLHDQCNDAGDNALVLLLNVLSQRTDHGNACRQELAKLADKLARVVTCSRKNVPYIKWIVSLLLLAFLIIAGINSIIDLPLSTPTIDANLLTDTLNTPVPTERLLPTPTPPETCPIIAVQFSRDGGQLLPENNQLQLNPNQSTEITARIETLPGCSVSIIWEQTGGQFLSVGGQPCISRVCGSDSNRTYQQQGNKFSEFDVMYEAPKRSGKYDISIKIDARSTRTNITTINAKQIIVEVRE